MAKPPKDSISGLDRFAALETDDEREGFRKALRDFVRLYSLVAQIVAWGDRDLERLYQYGRVLLIRLPGRPQVSVDVGDAERNTEFMKLYFDNAEFQKAIKEAARRRAYRIITDPARDEALARLRAEMARETGGDAAG